MIQVVIWKAYPKPVCHIFVRVSKLLKRILTEVGVILEHAKVDICYGQFTMLMCNK